MVSILSFTGLNRTVQSLLAASNCRQKSIIDDVVLVENSDNSLVLTSIRALCSSAITGIRPTKQQLKNAQKAPKFNGEQNG